MTDETEKPEDEIVEDAAEQTVEAPEGATMVKFVGDPNDDFSGPSSMTMFGEEFPKGEFVAITDENVLRKLRGHNHFAFQGEAAPKASGGKGDDLAQIGAGVGGLERLKDLARSEGVPFEDDTTKPKLMKAIRAMRQRRGNDA